MFFFLFTSLGIYCVRLTQALRNTHHYTQIHLIKSVFFVTCSFAFYNNNYLLIAIVFSTCKESGYQRFYAIIIESGHEDWKSHKMKQNEWKQNEFQPSRQFFVHSISLISQFQSYNFDSKIRPKCDLLHGARWGCKHYLHLLSCLCFNCL